MEKTVYPTEIWDVTIEKINSKGYGYTRYIHPPDKGSNGKHLNINVKNVVPGDVVRVAVENAKGRNKVVVDYDELLKAGPTRNLKTPTHKAVSGGTPLQYMYYDNQLVYKMDTFRDDVKKELSKGATVSKPSTGGKKLYRVQIGAYSAKKNADKQLEKAKKAGFKDAFMKYE